MENTATQAAVAVPDEPVGTPTSNPSPPPAGPAAETAKAPVDRIEIEKMREMLREQQKAAARVMNTISELQTKFSLTQAQFEKIGRDYQAISSRSGPALPQITLPTPEWDVPVVPFAAPVKQRSLARTTVGVTAIVAAAIGWGVVFWLLFTKPQGVDAPSPPAILVPSRPPVSERLPTKDPPAAFRMALAELDAALTQIPGKLPGDLLWEASQKDGSCLVLWNDGYPSLLFGSGKPRPMSLSMTIARCADAVRRLHDDANSP